MNSGHFNERYHAYEMHFLRLLFRFERNRLRDFANVSDSMKRFRSSYVSSSDHFKAGFDGERL